MFATIATSTFGQIFKNKYLIVIGSFIFLILMFYTYYSYASNKIDEYHDENTKLAEEVVKLNFTMETLKKDYKKVIRANTEVQEVLTGTRKSLDDLRNSIYRENLGKKSLGELANRKPILVENAINNAIEKNILCLENLSAGGDCL